MCKKRVGCNVTGCLVYSMVFTSNRNLTQR